MEIPNGKLWFRLFWKDNISKNIIIEKVIIFYDLICKIVNLIYDLKKRKKKIQFLTDVKLKIS